MMSETKTRTVETIADKDVRYYLALPRVERPFHMEGDRVMQDKTVYGSAKAVYAIGYKKEAREKEESNPDVYLITGTEGDDLVGIKLDPKSRKYRRITKRVGSSVISYKYGPSYAIDGELNFWQRNDTHWHIHGAMNPKLVMDRDRTVEVVRALEGK